MENPFEVIIEKLNRIEEQLNRLEQNKTNQDELMDVDTLGNYINYQKTSIYGLVQKNKIPYIKRGKLYFRKKDIDSWLNQGKKETQEDVKKLAEKHLSIKHLSRK